MWHLWWSFADVGQQGLHFSKNISKRNIFFWFDFHRCSHMGRQKVPKSDFFKVIFLYQKSFESFWGFFSVKNISLEQGFLLLSFFDNFNFWTTLFIEKGPNFWWFVWSSVKIKSKKYFYVTDFFAKIYSLLTHVRKTLPLRSHYGKYS